LIAPVADEIYSRLSGMIMGEDDDRIEDKIAEQLQQRGYTLSLLETFTGGMIAERLSRVAPHILVQGLVVPRHDVELNVQRAIDMVDAYMLRLKSNCTLVCLYQEAAAQAL